VQKGILSVANIHKSGIQTGHQFSDFPDEYIADGKVVVCFLVVKFGQFATLHQGKFNTVFRDVDYKFFIHVT
jgi:hypothetical protein